MRYGRGSLQPRLVKKVYAVPGIAWDDCGHCSILDPVLVTAQKMLHLLFLQKVKTPAFQAGSILLVVGL